MSPMSPSSHPVNRRFTIPYATPTRNLVSRLVESVPYYTPPPVPASLDRSKEDDLDRRMREQAYYEEIMGQPKTSIVDKITSAMQNKFLHRLLRSERWISSLLQMSENLPVSIMLLRATREFPVMYMNPAFCASFGHDARELIGESYLSVLLQLQNPTLTSLQHAHKFGPLVGEALVSAKKFEFMFYTYSTGDKLVPALAAMKPMFDQNGEYKFVLVCMLTLNVDGSSDYTNIVLMDHIFRLFPDHIVTCNAEAETLL
jgi:PAS domain-containing protein